MMISKKRLVILFFQLSVISYYSLDLSESYFKISKGIILLFFIIAFIDLIASKFQFTSILLLPISFFLLLSASYFWASNKELVVNGIVSQFQFILLFFFTFYALRNRASLNDYYLALYFSGLCLMFLSIYQYGFNTIINEIINGVRLGGKLGNENKYGMAFAQSAIVAFYYFISSKKKMHLINFIVFLVFSLGSGSKKATLMIIFGVMFLILLSYRLKYFGKFLASIFLFSFFFILIIKLPLFAMINERFRLLISGESTSDIYRFNMIRTGLELFKHKPIFGYGYNNYTAVSGYGVYSHNNYIELAVDLGLIGLIIYYSIYIYSIYVIIKPIIHQKNKQNVYNLVFVLLVTELLMGFGAVQFVEKSLWISFGVFLATADNIRFRYQQTGLLKLSQ